jgi:anti-sigma regulatory factor (Ser/Thr protein kinase)
MSAMPRAERAWPATPRSVGAARAFVEERLEQWGAAGHIWPAVTVVSELATNAVLHARTGFTVAIELAGPQLRLSVSDESPSVPSRRHYDVDAATGRGIALLESLTTSWGIDTRGTGKSVWCVVEPVDLGGTDRSDHETTGPVAQPRSRVTGPPDSRSPSALFLAA